MTIKEELQNVKEMVDILFRERIVPMGEGMTPELNMGLQSLVRLEELIDELDPEGVK